jgi:hypothetical protein
MGLGAITLPLGHELPVDLGGPATHAQPARQFALLAQASLDAAVHHRPEAVEPLLDLTGD